MIDGWEERDRHATSRSARKDYRTTRRSKKKAHNKPYCYRPRNTTFVKLTRLGKESHSNATRQEEGLTRDDKVKIYHVCCNEKGAVHGKEASVISSTEEDEEAAAAIGPVSDEHAYSTSAGLPSDRKPKLPSSQHDSTGFKCLDTVHLDLNIALKSAVTLAAQRKLPIWSSEGAFYEGLIRGAIAPLTNLATERKFIALSLSSVITWLDQCGSYVAALNERAICLDLGSKTMHECEMVFRDDRKLFHLHDQYDFEKTQQGPPAVPGCCRLTPALE